LSQPDRCLSNSEDIPEAEIESIIEPDGVGNDVRRESVAFVRIHTRKGGIDPGLILLYLTVLLVSTLILITFIEKARNLT
tara:strand:- start:5792 stop:6031 length:240 start_codon:yes stop_codon:yes gene_type:complete